MNEPNVPLDPVARLYASIEQDILVNAGKVLGANRALLNEDIESWRLLQLQKLGSLSQDNLLIVARYSGRSVEELTELLQEAGFEAVAETDKMLAPAVTQGAVLLPAASNANNTNQILQTYVNRARSNMNLANATLLNTFESEFRSILDETVAKVLTGNKTPDQALRETARAWADKGLTGHITRDNRKLSIEPYINSVIRTASTGVANDMQDARMDEYDIDLVEISEHMGARPKCALYQGKIFSRSGTSDKYPALASTSIGEADGLFGINCRHVKYAFVEGVSIKRPSKIDQAENERVYKESQAQRKLERDIRKAKQEMNMMDAMGDVEGVNMARQKLLGRQANMRTFINQTGRTRRRNREQLAVNNPRG